MRLSEYKETFYWHSEKASDVARTAALAGIAVIWVFKIDRSRAPAIPKELVLPAALLIATLALDLFQYVFGALIWWSFHRYHERRIDDVNADPEMSHSTILIWPISAMFIGKLMAVVAGYILLGLYVVGIWVESGTG